MLSAFPEGNNFSAEVVAEVWAGILNAHKDYLRYVAYLMTIIETNVTVERLAVFKKKWYGFSDELSKRLSVMLNIEESSAAKLIVDIQMYASQLVTSYLNNPLILQALKLIEREVKQTEFCEAIKDYTKMCINWCISKKTKKYSAAILRRIAGPPKAIGLTNKHKNRWLSLSKPPDTECA